MQQLVVVFVAVVVMFGVLGVILQLVKYKKKPSGCCGVGHCSTAEHHVHGDSECCGGKNHQS